MGEQGKTMHKTPPENKKKIELEHAQALLLEEAVFKEIVEACSLHEAFGRVLAQAVYAVQSTPPFDRSPLDGYALHSADSVQASRPEPVRLRVVETLFAGDVPRHTLRRGEAARIMTGAMLPKGANCVIKQEETTRSEDHVCLTRTLAQQENVVHRGEDVENGQLLLPKGRRIGPAEIGLLAGQGIGEVTVFARPAVAVAATGSELVPVGTALPEGKIFDSNSHLLAARCHARHAHVHTRCVLADEEESLLSTLNALLNEVPLVITTGGVSVGDRDLLPKVAANLGGEVLFHGIGVRPGGPVLALSRGGHILLCLSGNPFAALATFEVLAVPLLKKLAGEHDCHLQTATAKVSTAFEKKSPMRRLLRARVVGETVHIPTLGHASSQLHSLLDCNCLIDIPKGSGPLAAGERVGLILFE